MNCPEFNNKTRSANLHLDNIIDCIKLIAEVNLMPFDEFVTFIEESSKDFKFSKEELDEWKFVGLNNIDFIKSKILKYDNHKVLKF